ncbi:MAG: cyclase [Thermoleophilia bacterium]
MMAHILVRNTVKDYDTWKQSFDKHSPMRKAAGSSGGRLFQSADNPNDVLLILEWDDVEKAREFAGSAQLREAMEEAGVVGQPEVRYLAAEELIAV